MTDEITPREILKKVIHFDNPPRYGMYFGKFGMDDTVDVFDFFIKDENGVDPWGITWTVHPDTPSIGIPKSYPLQNDFDLSKITVPNPKEFAQKVEKALEEIPEENRKKYRFIATSSGIWERIQYFRGMEQIMEDFILNPDRVKTLVNTCTEFWVNFLNELSGIKDELDAIYMFDDWGTQNGIMISRGMWQENFSESYKQIADAAHANQMDFWLHSCGKITELIGDFIAAGIDLVSPFQSGTCGYEYVAEHYAGKVAFMTTVDTQSTLPHGTREEILEECKLLEKWGTKHGGLIVGYYGYDIDESNERVVFDYFMNNKPGENNENVS
jgi:uroporphyrinogen-III decarboxylase